LIFFFSPYIFAACARAIGIGEDHTSAQSLGRKDMTIFSFQCVSWLVLLGFTGLFVAALEEENFSNGVVGKIFVDAAS